MQIIQPHFHGISRTAQDYQRMAMSGVVAGLPNLPSGQGSTANIPRLLSIIFGKLVSLSQCGQPGMAFGTFAGWQSTRKRRKTWVCGREVIAHLPEFFQRPYGRRRGRDGAL